VEVPRIRFTGKIYEEIVEFDPTLVLKRRIWISDTTFRDGQQARPPYTVKQIVEIYRLLSKLSGPHGVIGQSEFFLYSQKDRKAVEQCLELGYRYPEVTGWVRANLGDLSLVERMGLKETGVLTSCSDYHIFYKLRRDRKQVFDDYIKVVERAFELGIRLRCHLEDVTRADIDGFVIPFVSKLVELSEQVPEEMRVKIRLCDTMGFGITFPGAALPRSIPKLIYKIIHEAGMPSERLEWHGHNDFHKVHINAVSAWVYGCDIVNTTLFGFGERTGNPPLEGAVMEYIGLKGNTNGIDTCVITEIAEYFEKEIGVKITTCLPVRW
jgi:isopropylmalate/homocitrate/citramalate synthase